MKNEKQNHNDHKNNPLKEEEKLPGYPHYNASEDIFNKEKEIDINVDDPTIPLSEAPDKVVEREKDALENEEKKSRNDADITDEDLKVLGDQDSDPLHGEDEALMKDRMYPIDLSGDDLDVPGADLDDASEAMGEEDEENNFYSLPEDQ